MNFDFNLEPKEAIDFIAKKHPELHFDYDEISHDAHLKAFTIAKITKLDLLKELQDSISSAIKEGKSFEVWKKEITPTLQKKGWLGNIEVVNPKNGEKKQVFVGSRRLKNIYYTNARAAYAQARAKAQYELEGEVYLRYVALLDGLTRPSHSALHGLILPREDAFWERNYPPNAWNCRCKVQALYKKDIDKQGWEVTKNPPAFTPHKDWDYDTRNLKGDFKDLENILEKKLESYKDNPSFTKALQELREDKNQAIKNYNAIKELRSGGLTKIPLAKLPQDIMRRLGAKSDELLLSYGTLQDHLQKHPEVSFLDYSLLPFLLADANIYRIKSTKEHHIVLFSRFDKYYRAVIKTTKNKEENYLLSLVKGDKKIEK